MTCTAMQPYAHIAHFTSVWQKAALNSISQLAWKTHGEVIELFICDIIFVRRELYTQRIHFAFDDLPQGLLKVTNRAFM